MKTPVRFAVIASLVFATLCEARDIGETPRSAAHPGAPWRHYFPLKEDSTWIYRFTNFMSDTRSTVTIRARRGQPIAGLTMTGAHVFEETRGGDRSPVVYYEDAVGYLMQFLDATYGPDGALEVPPRFGDAVQILPPHLAVGVEWVQHAVTVGRVRWKHAIAAWETVTVPAGVFPGCYRIDATVGPDDEGDIGKALGRYGMFNFRYTDWYAKGVGLVKSTTTTLHEGKPVVTEELESYSLVPALTEGGGASTRPLAH